MTTLKAARADLASQITAAVAALGGISVLDFDPPAVGGGTVTVSTAGATATEWRLWVRVYADANQSSEGQALLDDIAEAVDLGLGSGAGRSDWAWVYDEGKDSFVFQTVVDYPREDWG